MDPLNFEEYVKYSIFLADINQERVEFLCNDLSVNFKLVEASERKLQGKPDEA